MKMRRSVGSLFLAAALLLLAPRLRLATAQLLGPEFQVNSYTTSLQRHPAVAADGSGNFVVVWESRYQDGSFEGVFGQRFNSAGTSIGSEFQVNTYTTSYQRYPAVAADGSGNFVVVWESRYQDGSTYGVFGQRFNSAGGKVGIEFQVNTYTTSYQLSPAVAADSLGNFVVVWESSLQDGDGYGVFGQCYSSAGSPAGSEFQVNTYTTNSQRKPVVAADGSGNFVVVWESSLQDGDGYGVFGQRYNSAGSRVGGEFRVNTYTTNTQRDPTVAADVSGNFVVAWASPQDGSGYGVFGQRFNTAGSSVGSEFQVNTYTTSYQNRAAVAADGSGNIVVAWHSIGQDGSGAGVFGQRYSAAGIPVGSEFQVNTYTTSYQFFPALAADGWGNFIVAWQSAGQDGSSYGVFGRWMNFSIFSDGFELGDASAWSATVGGGCP